jgi:hypothetical protein
LLAGATVITLVTSTQARTVEFSGYHWTVKSGDRVGPGPNNWDENNVWMDHDGRLHLALTSRNARWYCAEVSTLERLGFGRYEFLVSGSIDNLDPNVVLGLFSYPTADVGTDGTHEIDIEFARWSEPRTPIGNYTVWPTARGLRHAHKSLPVELDTTASIHRFVRDSTSVIFQSLRRHDRDNRNEIASWEYRPKDTGRTISQEPMPVHMNLWLFRGHPPANGENLEIIIDAFRFIPK